MTSGPQPPDPPVPVVMDAGPPPPGLPVPAPVAAEAGAERLRAVWANELGGATFEIGTGALPGEMAVTDRWKEQPGTAVTAIGEGLRAMHEALPAGRCPFSWSAADRLR